MAFVPKSVFSWTPYMAQISSCRSKLQKIACACDCNFIYVAFLKYVTSLKWEINANHDPHSDTSIFQIIHRISHNFNKILMKSVWKHGICYIYTTVLILMYSVYIFWLVNFWSIEWELSGFSVQLRMHVSGYSKANNLWNFSTWEWYLYVFYCRLYTKIK